MYFCSFAAIVLLEPVSSGVGALFLSCNPRQKQTIEHWVTKLAWSVFRGHVFLVWTSPSSSNPAKFFVIQTWVCVHTLNTIQQDGNCR
jgi:hypothetical protein